MVTDRQTLVNQLLDGSTPVEVLRALQVGLYRQSALKQDVGLVNVAEFVGEVAQKVETVKDDKLAGLLAAQANPVTVAGQVRKRKPGAGRPKKKVEQPVDSLPDGGALAAAAAESDAQANQHPTPDF